MLDEERAAGEITDSAAAIPDDKKKQFYGNLFFLFQTEPRIVAHLTRLVSLSEIDNLLQTVMFTLYGNQYDNREEHLLLTMFQVYLKAYYLAVLFFSLSYKMNLPQHRISALCYVPTRLFLE